MACCKHQGCETRKEALLDAASLTTAAGQGAAIISKLLEIATAGGTQLWFKDDPKLSELAAQINRLAAENQYLKKKLGGDAAPTITIDRADLTLKFGANNEYALIVPVGDPAARRKLARQLFDAAADLVSTSPASAPLPGQKSLPFVEE